jgi:pyocin large subunit-like protein
MDKRNLGVPGAFALGFMTIGLLSMTACDGAPSANAARSHASAGADRRLVDSAPEGGEVRGPGDRRQDGYSAAAYTSGSAREAEATPLFHGKPLWAANKRHSAQENADYQFKKGGEALGAKTEDEFLTKVHAFVDHPPKGAETLTRANGDTLIYDKASNTFAVVTKDGAPRTLFKPDSGASYWDQQKQDQASGDDSYRKRRSARRSSSDDNG